MDAINPEKRNIGQHQYQKHENINIFKLELKFDDEIGRRDKLDPQFAQSK